MPPPPSNESNQRPLSRKREGMERARNALSAKVTLCWEIASPPFTPRPFLEERGSHLAAGWCVSIVSHTYPFMVALLLVVLVVVMFPFFLRLLLLPYSQHTTFLS